MAEPSDDELLAELGVTVEPEKAGGRTPREERILAGFQDIQRFFESYGRAPRHGEQLDIFERLYAVRLDRLRAMPEARDGKATVLLTPRSGGAGWRIVHLHSSTPSE